MTVHARCLSAALAGLALLWLGMLAGVSFLATPVKFLASSLTLPIALDVGRQTFGVFNKVEIVLGMAVLLCAILALRLEKDAWRHAAVALGLALLTLVLAQTLWLLPVLDSRVEIILQGGAAPPSQLHRLYIAADLLKLGALGTLSWLPVKDLLRAPRGNPGLA